jgi:hypothetical protein
MRKYLAALAASVGLLCVSIALAQKEKPPAYKYHKDAQVYAELVKAPQRRAPNAILWKMILTRSLLEEISLNNTVQSATVIRRKAAGRARASWWSKCKTPSRAPFSGC